MDQFVGFRVAESRQIVNNAPVLINKKITAAIAAFRSRPLEETMLDLQEAIHLIQKLKSAIFYLHNTKP